MKRQLLEDISSDKTPLSFDDGYNKGVQESRQQIKELQERNRQLVVENAALIRKIDRIYGHNR